jgi:hypothetical protein
MKFRKALGVAALGTGAKEGSKILGLGETSQEAAKVGTMLVASMFNPKGVKQLYDNFYHEADRLVPPGTMVSARPLEAKLNNLKNKLKQGILAPSEEAVLTNLEKVAKKIKNGQVDLKEMMATNRSLNEVIGDPKLLKRGKTLFNELKKAVNDAIKLHRDPEFVKNWRGANEAFGGLHESQKMTRFVSKHLGPLPLKHAVLAGAGEAVAGYPEAAVPTIIAATAGYVGMKGAELMHRIVSNPTLRKYYGDVLTHAAAENAKAMNASAANLTRALKGGDARQNRLQKTDTRKS